MWKKVATVTAIGVLAIGLVAGSVYYALRPEVAHADGNGGRGARSSEVVSGANENAAGLRGRGQGGSALGGNAGTCDGTCEDCTQESMRQGQGGGFARAGQGSGRLGQVEPTNWVTVEGRVVATEDELILETAGGETMVVHVGPEWYREQHGYQITAGDQLAVRGFYWEGDFEAGQIDNQTTGQVIELRDENGFPLWGGRGRGRL